MLFMWHSIAFVTTFLLQLTYSFQFVTKHGPKPAPTPYHDWDYLMFSQRWPITSCVHWEETNPANTCNMPPDKSLWIIHGIWPTKTGMEGPLFCPSAVHFDPQQLEPFMDELKAHWTNVEGNTKPNSFWKHEWDKHGTCAVVLPALNSIHSYFMQALEWNKQYDLSSILTASKITPSSNGYNVEDIYKAVETYIKAKPIVECVSDKNKEFMISEIRICFNKSLEVIDCDNTRHKNLISDDLIINCNVNKPVMYFSEVPPKDISYEMDYLDDVFRKNYEEQMYYVRLYRFLKFLMWFTT